MTPHPVIPQHLSVGYTLQASKWQKCPLLIDVEEMRDLMTSIGPFWIVQVSGVIKRGDEVIDPKLFLEVYSNYIEALKEGRVPADPRIRSLFSSVWTTDLESIYTVPVSESTVLVKVAKPVVQLQSHRFDYSSADGSFRSMVLGQEAVDWGIQFSFPHFYQDAECQVVTVREEEQFPNAFLFKKVQQWVRGHTSPIPFDIDGKRVNVPIRIGKQCFSWINQHRQLILKDLKIIH